MKTVNNTQTVKRDDYISWDEYFIGIAKLSSMRSKDPSTQVGCCIVSQDNRILSVGYNGAPNGFDDDSFPWARIGEKLETKYMYVCHSELNAILNYRGNMQDLQGSRIYVRYFPCNECAKAIIQSGIREVIYSHSYDYDNHSEEMEASIRMFDKCGVKYRKFVPENKKEIVLHLED
ncbi:MAG: dCMP deaminase family protein [Bacilli bacterium]|nr:dCMP deaminase family protein [Bacilli bacterium]